MQKYQKQDRSTSVLVVTLCVVAILVAISAIPPFELNGMHVRRANLLSSFVLTDEIDGTCTTSSSERIEGDKLISTYTEETVREIPAPVSEATARAQVKTSEPPDPTASDTLDLLDSEAGIEDYSDSAYMMRSFLRNLSGESSLRNVRIAFLGDSFIEGDILTSALRNEMQAEFGGEGVGFVPFADPIAKYRGTVKQEHSGWTCYNLLRKNKVPEHYKNDFFVSGYVCVPVPGASARFTSGSYKGRKLSSSHARIYFKNRELGAMDVIVNDSDTLHYSLTISDSVQCIDIHRDRIDALAISLPVCNDFIGYGVAFEGESGVTIDNYGLRSHNGVSLLATSREVNMQMADLRDYDLIVMEYGLNAMQKSVTQYREYMEKYSRAVKHVRASFPNSPIMLMSVGDVGMKVDNQVITAPAVPAMVGYQRRVARDCDVSFFNLFREMGGEGSMKRFVEKGWANKDYLHINFRGGEQLAKTILNSIRDYPEYNSGI